MAAFGAAKAAATVEVVTVEAMMEAMKVAVTGVE